MSTISTALRDGVKDSLRIVSYNVLSSHLCDPKYFTACTPENLNQNNRLQKVFAKLSRETDKGSIVCLQEVSSLWAGHLHTFFQQRNYYFITSLYGRAFNGYMGIGLAIPNDKFKLVDSMITRVADGKVMPRRSYTFVEQLINKLKKFITSIVVTIGLYKPPNDVWRLSLDRKNTMICVHVEDRATGKDFVVGNYHMPCMFWEPAAMNVHIALSVQALQSWAKGRPYIYAGDLNIKPNSPHYTLLTNGAIEESDPTYPPIVDDWRPVTAPMRSAYATLKGSEPDFTNYAQIKTEPTFIEVLDYIWLSPEWIVENVIDLPDRKDVKGPLPNDEEPSDHLLIAADLKLN